MRTAALALLASLLAAAAAVAATAPAAGSAFVLPAIAGDSRPTLMLAQRAIDRTWGPSEDTVYTEVHVQDWRSEGLAATASAILPGAGHVYVGENSGYLYALAEASGWVAHTLFHQKAVDRREQAERFAGTPTDASSGWSATRWADATGGDPAEIEALYAADRSAYLRLIASDDRYLAGWSGNTSASRSQFQGLRQSSQEMYRRARYAEMGLWLNHLVSAVDALRIARLHDLPLRRNLDLKLRGSWRGGRPALLAAVERSF
jgi:hypothetical protein